MKHDTNTRVIGALADFEVRASDDETTFQLRGYAAVFDSLSEPIFGMREQIKRGAFRRALKDGEVVLLWEHNPRYLLASTASGGLSLKEDPKGLAVRAELDGEDPDVRSAVRKMQRGDLRGMSFGFSGMGFEIEQALNDDGDEEQVRTITDIGRLHDVTVTAMPAYPAASAEIRSAPGFITPDGWVFPTTTNHTEDIRSQSSEEELGEVAGDSDDAPASDEGDAADEQETAVEGEGERAHSLAARQRRQRLQEQAAPTTTTNGGS